MTDTEILTALKIDLGIVTNAYDSRLTSYIKTAREQLALEGVRDDKKESYNTLVIMYAAWLWRKRVTGEGMPRMIRFAINNAAFDQHINGNGVTEP